MPQRNLCTEQFLHTFFFGTKQNKQRENCTHRLHQKNTHRNFCTQKLYPEQSLHGRFFSAHKKFPFRLVFTAQQFYRQMVFTQKILRTEVLRTEGFTHNIFYIQTLLYTDAFTRKTNCTQKLVHTAHFYTQPTFTQRERFCFPFLITFRVPPLKCFSQGLTLAIFYGNPLLVSFNAGNVADLSSVDPGLVDVQEVQSSSSAFAAILANGKVVAWGDFEGGGEMTQGAEMQRWCKVCWTSYDWYTAPHAKWKAINLLNSVDTSGHNRLLEHVGTGTMRPVGFQPTPPPKIPTYTPTHSL